MNSIFLINVFSFKKKYCFWQFCLLHKKLKSIKINIYIKITIKNKGLFHKHPHFFPFKVIINFHSNSLFIATISTVHCLISKEGATQHWHTSSWRGPME